jgi:ribose transport system ATP-binding protein
LLSRPRILILDESSAALDFDSTERLFAQMRALRDAGTTVIIVTHRIAELIRISDRATVLRDGRDVGVLEKHEINERNLLSLMTGDELAGAHPDVAAPQPRSDTPVLKASGLSLSHASRRFDFELRRGEIVGVAGLDGQGQDGFVRVLAGVHPAGDGRVEVIDRHGAWHVIRSLADAVAGKVVYVSGDRKREGIFAALTIFENMVMPLYREKRHGGILGIIDGESLTATFRRETERLLIKFGARGDKITSLSGGNQQKVLIGRGFAMRPDIIVLNDPARGIDVGAKTELYKHLRQFAAEGKSVVYLSSELEEFLGFATRMIVFRDGAPFDAFAGQTLDPRRILEAMFGQTDRMGLRASFGPTPSRHVEMPAEPSVSKTDGVRVVVRVPPALRPATSVAAATSAVPSDLTVAVPPGMPAGRRIRIVAFPSDDIASGGARR